MGEEVIRSKATGACSHGGIYSVNPRLVRLDCSSNINPLGTPKKAIAAVKMNASPLVETYPDPECRELKKSLSRYLGIEPECMRSEEHTSELQSRQYLVCRLLLEKKKNNNFYIL